MFIVVTGASRGIGLEIVKQFLSDEENTVLAVSRNARELDKLKKSNANLITVYGDLTKTSVLNSIASLIDKNGKRVDILINNAGSIVNKPFEKIKSEEIQQVYSVNVFAPFLLIQKLIPRMGKKSKSHIVNIGSMGGFQGSSKFAGLSAYSSSKSAIAGLTECLAEELKTRPESGLAPHHQPPHRLHRHKKQQQRAATGRYKSLPSTCINNSDSS